VIRRTVTVLLLSSLAACSGAAASAPRRAPAPAAPAGSAADPAAAVADVVALARLLDRLEAERVGAYLASIPPPPPAVEPVLPPAPAGGSGFHSDAWWRGVSGCEQGGLDNPTFGYFSIMDGSAAGRSWADQEAEANGLLEAAVAATGSESPAWAPSCVAAGYAASPGG